MGPMYLHYFTQDASFPFYIQYGYHEEDVEMHLHADFSELVIVMNGTAMHHVNNEAFFIKKGDVFVLNEEISHGYFDVNHLEICNIMFHPQIFRSLDSDIRTLTGFHALFVIEPYLTQNKSFESHLRLSLDSFEAIHNLTDIIIEEYDKKRPGRKTILNAYFYILITTLSRLYTLPVNPEENTIINIARSVSYIESHFTEPISIAQLAEISNMSTRHFSRIFSASYHMTPGNYILSLRMQHACVLLKTTKDTISEIAYRSGFNDSNYFSRQFQKMYHISPRDYRKQKV